MIEYELTLSGKQEELKIGSLFDPDGESLTSGGFAPNTTYLFVGKLSGNGADANMLQASLLPSGSVVGNFTDPSFPWMLTAHGGAGYNPILTQLQFRSTFEGNFTVGNLWLGNATAFFTPTAASMGDYNNDGMVDATDYLIWRNTMGQSGAGLAADGNGNNQIDPADYDVWQRNFGVATGFGAAAVASAPVPEPTSSSLLILSSVYIAYARIGARRRRDR